MILIDNQQKLTEICIEINKEQIIGVDTEFQRRHTYFAKLSLIQIQARNKQIIIDTLALTNLDIVKKLLTNHSILKVFHAPEQDLEIFYQYFKILPVNIFDTQIAASMCGFKAHTSYSILCQEICNVTLDKTHQKADWLKRPLDRELLEYAARDVEYLKEIYLYLQAKLEQNNLLESYFKRIAGLLSPEKYIIDYQSAWQKVKFTNRSSEFIRKMQILAAFREEAASALDIPRQHFATDQDLVLICQRLPQTLSELGRLPITTKQLFNTKYGARLLELCIGLKEDI